MTSEPIGDFIDGDGAPARAGSALAALAGFYRAFNTRDLVLMRQKWDETDDISMDNPLGGIMRGWDQIGAVYRRIFAGPGRVRVAFHDYTLHELGDVFLAVGRERGRMEMPGRTFDLAIRTSRLFRRTPQGWRQMHHHGSFEDPKLLAAYQEAVGAKPAASAI